MLSRSAYLFASFRHESLYWDVLRINRRSRCHKNVLHQAIKIPSAYSAAFYKSCQSSTSCDGGSKSKIEIKYKPFREICWVDHDYKNMVDYNRPMSPHMAIFGPTVTSMTSIIQRATGIAAVCYTLALSASVYCISGGVNQVIKWIQDLNLPEAVIIGLKFGVAVIFLFHYFNGIRFVLFNLGKLLDVKPYYTTAYAAIVASFVGGAACAMIGHAY